MTHYDLQLMRGGFLSRMVWSDQEGSFVEEVLENGEVTENLYSTLCIAQGVTLGDLLRLVRDHRELFRSAADIPSLDEFLADAFEREAEASYDLEFLRLGWIGVLDKDDDGRELVLRTTLHGRDSEGNDVAVEMSPICHLLDVPLEVDESIKVLDGDDPDAVLLSASMPMTILTVVHGVFEELAWFGSPERRDRELRTLQESIQEIEEGKVEMRSWEEIQEKMAARAEENRAQFECRECGDDARCPCFGKPADLCHSCFKKTKEN